MTIPKYRSASGRFRKETDAEFEKRCGRLALASRLMIRRFAEEICRVYSNPNPYSGLFKFVK